MRHTCRVGAGSRNQQPNPLETGPRECARVGRTHPPRPWADHAHPVPSTPPSRPDADGIEAGPVRGRPGRGRPSSRIEPTPVTVDVNPAVDGRIVERRAAPKPLSPGRTADGLDGQTGGFTSPARKAEIDRLARPPPGLEGPDGARRRTSEDPLVRNAHRCRWPGHVSSSHPPNNDTSPGSYHSVMSAAVRGPTHLGEALRVDA